MYNDKLSHDIQDSLKVNDKPEEVRKYGKKKKNKKFNYFLLFIFFLIISFCVFIALDIFFINKQMKKDLSTKEKGIDKSKALAIIQIIEKILEFLKEIINRFVLDKIDDEHIKQCIQLSETIKTLFDMINEDLKRDKSNSKTKLKEDIKRTKNLIDCIFEYWETNGYEKCFNPGGGTKDYLYNFQNNRMLVLHLRRPFLGYWSPVPLTFIIAILFSFLHIFSLSFIDHSGHYCPYTSSISPRVFCNMRSPYHWNCLYTLR